VGVERARGRVGRVRPARAPDPAVDHDVSDVDALRRELARHALGEAAQRELAHGEGRRLGIALDPRGGAGEQDRAVLLRQHAPRRLLGDEEAAIGGHRERLLHVERIELHGWTAGAGAVVVEPDCGRRDGSRSANSFSTSPRLVASQVNARAPVSLTSASRSPVVRAASATLIPSLASARARDAESPAPAPTMSAALNLTSVMAKSG